ncbi:energy-coupling factor transporter transmembrane protein EcfT [Corynebacterium sp. CCM 9185]|uniref:Energy-coupling factor transporter transmembrane protein EcfT n=1 Tax=Corynebacterium marambiense TaxID=2765364 RepID=A0ABS0VT96_9CORY|nr:energy-coupling factor transporter transmembrane protein EcfT [Corynebacterium marambiense]MCK7663351.1 energy-coupling factor transporter transmembrane protein EcfT [Corynebacterium marambiense]
MRHADPRTLILLLLTVNALMMGRTDQLVTIAGALLTVTALLFTGRARWAIVLLVSVFLLTAAAYWIPTHWPNSASALIGVLAFWISRFTVAAGIAVFVLTQLRPTELNAALRRMHTPHWLIIPLAVVVRFLPALLAETRAINEAMSLRGIRPGALGLLFHPVRYGIYVVIPLLSSAIRISDELAAAALIRGLGVTTLPDGSTVHPTTVTRIGFGLTDLVLLLGIAALVGLHFSGWELQR